MIQTNLSLSTSASDSWVLDIACGSHICKSLQGLHIIRSLKKGDFELHGVSGEAIQAEAMGTYFLLLPYGKILELKDCYFVPDGDPGHVQVLFSFFLICLHFLFLFPLFHLSPLFLFYQKPIPTLFQPYSIFFPGFFKTSQTLAHCPATPRSGMHDPWPPPPGHRRCSPALPSLEKPATHRPRPWEDE